ncbi:MAG: UTP--glucose-1-phosphate uridylyltransferase GalU [Clostridia bacterium]|nr:UTP--glucose-1-phosphate uridylyltransferase GalU [Clostridia bacterium]
MVIKKAIIPAAGLGTRVLPASKAIPKEMLPIVDKPAIQYIVEEAVASGITDILIITNRGKGVIEDHFDHSLELENMMTKRGNYSMLSELQAVAKLANIYFLRQKETKGLGDAVLKAESFVGEEPFAVLYGDDVIIGEPPATKEICEAYERYKKGVVGIKEVPDELLIKYSSLKVSPKEDRIYDVSDMIEKPAIGNKFSNFSVLGRCVLTPEIFDILRNTTLGVGNELQLTDAMKTLARRDGMIGVDFRATRYDMGSKFGMLKANVEVALAHKEIGDETKKYIKELAKTF